jgi:DNA-directed RNA polymerase specialized sigma24 family protein
MGKMKEIVMMYEEGYSAEYIANVLKTDTITIKKIIYGDKK